MARIKLVNLCPSKREETSRKETLANTYYAYILLIGDISLSLSLSLSLSIYIYTSLVSVRIQVKEEDRISQSETP